MLKVVGPEVGAEDQGRPVRLQLADETILLAIIDHPTTPEDRLCRTGRDGEPDARTASDVHEPLRIHLDGIGPVIARAAQKGRPEKLPGRVKFADEHIVVLHRPVRTVVVGAVEGPGRGREIVARRAAHRVDVALGVGREVPYLVLLTPPQ
jgi:hypothetical protein